MDFDFTEEQSLLKSSARDFLSKECPAEQVRVMLEDEVGYSKELWKKMAELGWMAITLPSGYGGVESSFLDLVLLQEEMGRFLLASPYLPTMLAARAISAVGSEEQKNTLLPKITAGDLIIALAITEPNGRWDAEGQTVKAVRHGEDFIISGTKLFIPFAHTADLLLCAVRTGEESSSEKGMTLFLVDAETTDVQILPLKSTTGEKLCEITFEKVKVLESDILGKIDQGWPVLETIIAEGAITECGTIIGGAGWVLETSVDYARNRFQFGVPIGSFQAIQHKCADIMTAVDGATLITYHAAWAITEDSADHSEAASKAKAWCSDVYNQVTNEGVQILGGMGFTQEHDMQLYFRRARASELAFGDGHHHRQKLLRELWGHLT